MVYYGKLYWSLVVDALLSIVRATVCVIQNYREEKTSQLHQSQNLPWAPPTQHTGIVSEYLKAIYIFSLLDSFHDASLQLFLSPLLCFLIYPQRPGACDCLSSSGLFKHNDYVFIIYLETALQSSHSITCN